MACQPQVRVMNDTGSTIDGDISISDMKIHLHDLENGASTSYHSVLSATIENLTLEEGTDNHTNEAEETGEEVHGTYTGGRKELGLSKKYTISLKNNKTYTITEDL